MPHSVNGIGTGLVRASKARHVEGYKQFDAVEAVIFLLMPIVPYKVVHVMSIWGEGQGERYQAIRLRPSLRIIAKAFLNAWGNGLAIFGAGMGLLAGFAFLTMDRPVNQTDRTFLIIALACFVAGVLSKLAWMALNRSDERIKDVIGAHELGTSDPYYWADDVAQPAAEALLEEESCSSLVDLAERLLTSGDRSKAMLCLRLAMRGEGDLRTQELFARALES
jgi:hypothetical protein